LIRWRPGVRQGLRWCVVGGVAAAATVALQEPMVGLGAVLSGPFGRVAARVVPFGLADAGLIWAQIAIGLALALGLAPWFAPAAPSSETGLDPAPGEPTPRLA